MFGHGGLCSLCPWDEFFLRDECLLHESVWHLRGISPVETAQECNFCHMEHAPEERQLPKPSSRPAKGKRDKEPGRTTTWLPDPDLKNWSQRLKDFKSIFVHGRSKSRFKTVRLVNWSLFFIFWWQFRPPTMMCRFAIFLGQTADSCWEAQMESIFLIARIKQTQDLFGESLICAP